MKSSVVIRSASITGYADVARSVGLDPARVARRAGVDLRLLTSPDALIPARSAHRLLTLSAAMSGAEDFGLRLVRKRGLSHLGALGALARDEPDVRSAIGRIESDMSLHSTCVALHLEESRGLAVLTLSLLADGESEIRQSTEVALGQLFQTLLSLLGTRWRPVTVQFIHSRGATDRPHRALFKCPVAFSSDRNAIILRSADLDQPMPGADPGFRANVPRPATSPLVVGRAISPQQVKQALAVLMPRGECTSVAVSHRLGVDRRTLHRHLTRAGVDFSTVLAEMRSELVAQYVKADTLSMTAIGELLGFTSLSSYSRWFRSAFGCAPTRWRVD